MHSPLFCPPSIPSRSTIVSRAINLTLLLAASVLAAPSPAAEPIATKSMPDNPLLAESSLPFNYPRFDQIKNEHFAPAFELGMAEHLKEIEAIATNPEKPTFDNTIVALERAGELLGRVSTIFSSLTGCNTNDELQALQKTLAPKLSAHNDAIRLNPAIFARIDALYAARDTLGLDAESKRLLWRFNRDFVRAGAKLSAADKEKLKKLNSELATLQTAFSQNTLKERSAAAVVVDTRGELAGLSEAEISTAAAAAKKHGHEGKFELPLENTTGQAPLTNLTTRATRQKIMEASLARSSHGGAYDNRVIVSRLATLRAERAALLGYPTFAAYSLDDQTAGTVDVVNRMLAQLAPPAVANARREAADMQKIVDAEHGGFQLAAWDWQLYAEKVRKARYDFDESQLKPYLELNHVLLDGLFFATGKLYGLTFKERHDLPVYEPTVRVFDVFEADGTPLAIFIGDYYARSNKNGGAWMNAYVTQNTLLGRQPVIANHLNIPLPPAGQPTLLTPDEVRTLFHEFGHALHGMFSQVKYPRFGGTAVPRDFVEFPSQVNEMWRFWPDVLKNYAKHYQTGAPIPQVLVDKLRATEKFNQGYATLELVEANIIDQAWHQLAPGTVPGADQVEAFEAAALKKAGVDFPPVPPRYRSTYYSHSFAGGYSAGYYSYFWSEVLDADAVDWFKTHGGLTRANGDRLRQTVLSRGGSDEAMTLFKNFTGGEPDITPLLKRRGLDATAAPGAN